MEYSLIRFTDTELQDLHHAVADESDRLDSLPWQAGSAALLGDLCGNRATIFLLPQQLVFNTTIDLPEKASRQILSAIEYQVEERLAQDVDSQHVAMGDSQASPLPVSVVSREIMDRCLALVADHSLRLHAILSESALCPCEPDAIRVEVSQGYLLLRTGVNSAIKTDRQVLPVVLDLVARDTGTRLLSLAPGVGELALPAGWTSEVRQSAATLSTLLAKESINLLQRHYRLTSPVITMIRQWRWVAVFLLGFILLFVYNQSNRLQRLETEVAALKEQQFELVKSHVPVGTTADDNLKKLLIQAMGRQQAQSDDQGLLPVLQRFSKAKRGYQQVSISRISFQGQTLRVDLLSNQLNQVEDLLQTIRQSDGSASLDGLSVKPGEVSATLVIPGGSDV